MAVVTTLITACGGGSSGDSAAVIVETNQSGSGASRNGPFFNAEAGIGFANNFGKSMTRVFNAASGGVGDSFGEEPTEDSYFSSRAIQSDSFPCDTGSLDTSIDIDDESGELNGLALSFNNCNSGGSLSTGSMAVTISGSFDNPQYSLQFDNFTSTDADGTSAIDGMLNASGSQSGETSTMAISGSSLSMRLDDEQTTFKNYALTVVDTETSGTSALSGSAQLESSVDGNIDISINPPLSVGSEGDDYPESGGIVMTHSDGSSLAINADNGDPESFDYTISADGATTSGVERWDNTDLLIE